MDFTLEGKNITNNPSVSDIEHELNNLMTGEAEFVILGRGEEFIQAAPNVSNPRMLHVESRKMHSAGQSPTFMRYELRSLATLERAYELFRCFYDRELTSMAGAWRKIEEAPVSRQDLDVSMKSKIIFQSILSLAFIIGCLFAAYKLKTPWQVGLLTGLFASANFAGMIFLVPPLDRLALNIKQAIADRLGVACQASYSLHIHYKNPEQTSYIIRIVLPLIFFLITLIEVSLILLWLSLLWLVVEYGFQF